MFVLVDWINEGNDSPVYGIVNIDTAVYGHNAWRPADDIIIRTRHSAPRLAMIVKISECKRYIKKKKALLERQERQCNNDLRTCTQTINERSSEDPSNIMGARRNSRNFSIFTPTFNSRHNRMPSMGTQLRDALTANSSRRRSIVCSTPLPSSSSQQFRRLPINQATETEMSVGHIVERIEMLEETINNLRGKLLSIMPQATANPSTAESKSTEYLQQSGRSSSSSPGFVVKAISAEDETESSTGGSIGVDQEQHNSSNASNSSIGVDQEQQYSSNAPNSNIGVDQEQHNSSNASNSNIGIDQEQHNSSNASNSNIGIDQEQHNSSNASNSNIGVDQEQQYSSNVSNSNIGVDQEQHNSSNASNSNIGVDQEQHNSSNAFNSNNGADQEQLTSNDTNANMRYLVHHGKNDVTLGVNLISKIEWHSATTATWQLLEAIFPRRVLATQSLRQKTLDQQIVKQIVTVVSQACGVRRLEVSRIIVQKCLDEAKLLRNRQRRRQLLRESHSNEENLPPSTSSSD